MSVVVRSGVKVIVRDGIRIELVEGGGDPGSPGGGGQGVAHRMAAGVRLSLDADRPFAMVKDATALYVHAINGGQIVLWDGSDWTLVDVPTDPLLSIAASGLSVSTNYDVFAQPSGGSMTVFAEAWDRSTPGQNQFRDNAAIVLSDGVAVRGRFEESPNDEFVPEPEKRYLGSFGTDAAGLMQDHPAALLLDNYHNKRYSPIFVPHPDDDGSLVGADIDDIIITDDGDNVEPIDSDWKVTALLGLRGAANFFPTVTTEILSDHAIHALIKIHADYQSTPGDPIALFLGDGTTQDGYDTTFVQTDNLPAVLEASMSHDKLGRHIIVPMRTRSFGVQPDSGSFTPTDVPLPLLMWYDASDAQTVSVDGGGLVSQVEDKSGNGFHLAQSDDSFKPVFDATINGTTVLRFPDDRGSELSFSGIVNTTSAYTIVMVLRLNDLTVDNNRIFRIGGFGDPAVGINPIGDIEFQSIVLNTEQTTAIALMGVVDSTSQLFLNGGQPGSASPGVPSSPLTNIFIGKTNVSAAMDIAEVIVYTGVPTDADKNSLGGYINTKWGVAWTPVNEVPSPPIDWYIKRVGTSLAPAGRAIMQVWKPS